MSDRHPLQQAAVVLLRECFEGIPQGAQGTWFVQGKEGIFDAVDGLSAARASASPGPGLSSVASHVNHMVYILQGANALNGGREPLGSWEDTWTRQEYSDADWHGLVSSLREEYDKLMPFFASYSDWTAEDSAVGALALLPHLAYHLGAVRQLLKLV